MRRRSVDYTQRSKIDLESIYDYIADAGSPRTALSFIDRIERFCESLEYASERGMHHPDIRVGLRSISFEHAVTIVFQVSNDTVSILRVFSRGRDWTSELDSLRGQT